MTVIVDDRETRSFNKVKADVKFEYIIKRLPVGDYLLENDKTLLLERKSIDDFLSTFHELRARFYKMRLKADYVGLIVEGSPKVKNGQILQYRGNQGYVRVMSYSTYQKFLFRENAEGTLMFHTDNLEQTMMLIGALHDYLPELDKPRAIGCKAANLLTLIPGLGEVRAAEIMKQYDTPIQAFENIRFWLPAKSINTLGHW